MAKSMILIILTVVVICSGNSSVATEIAKETITPSGIRMMLIPGGSFEMGENHGADDEKTVHKVTVDAFLMDICEVTQESFEALMGTNPAKFRAPKGPVERTRWTDAIKYCNVRSLKDGLKPCYNLETGECDFTADGYRLPTEAEWEYACTGKNIFHKSTKKGDFYDTQTSLDHHFFLGSTTGFWRLVCRWNSKC